MLGGLVGMLMGHGFGAGLGGMLALLVQAGLIALVAMLAISFFRRRQAPAMGGAAPQAGPMGGMVAQFQDYQRAQSQPRANFTQTGVGGGDRREGDEIGLTDVDFDAFERLLVEIQTAFGRGDHDTLRALSTPEAMSYLAEELSRNAIDGRRNEISQVKLLQGDLSEAWREDDADWATVAMRYSSLDVTRDTAGAVVDGDPAQAIETTELWTFAKRRGPWGESWKLAAIQDT
jgi:predicted lipid-binding transport protein (Tim44 family)